MESLVIDFKPNGHVESLHMDAFDLGFLGQKATCRQTDIVFDSDTQLWNLEYLIGGGINSRYVDERLCGFPTYEEARSIEVAWLNNCRLLSIEPASEQGMRIMAGIRKHG